jgi:hypothetical protein
MQVIRRIEIDSMATNRHAIFAMVAPYLWTNK